MSKTTGHGAQEGRSRLPYIPMGHIDWAEAAAMLVVYDVAKAFLVFPQKMAADAQTAAWSVPLVSGLFSVLWLLALLAVLDRHPGRNLIEVTRELAGGPVAIVLGLVFYLYNVVVMATAAREVADALAIVVLTLTPFRVSLVGLFLGASYVALKGLEIVGRVSLLTVFGIIVSVVILSLLSASYWNLDYIFPLFGPGLWDLVKVYFARQAIFGEVMTAGMLAPYLRRPKDLGKAIWGALSVSAVTLAITVLSSGMVFPYPSLATVPVPFLRVIRLINLGRFLQRFDAVIVTVWLSAGVMKIAVGTSVSAISLGSAVRVKAYNLLVFITLVLAWAVANGIPRFAEATVLDFAIVRPSGLVLINGWPLLLLVLSRWKGRAGAKNTGTA